MLKRAGSHGGAPSRGLGPARAMLIWVPVLVSLLLTPALAGAVVTQTKREITEIQKTVLDLRGEIAALRVLINQLPSGNSYSLLRDNQGDLLAQLQEILGQVQSLTGRFEEARYYQEKFFKETAEDVKDLSGKVNSWNQGLTREEALALIERVGALEAELAALKGTSPATASAPPKPAKTVPPDVIAPDAAGPDVIAPDAAGPDVIAPDAAGPDVIAPDAAGPDVIAPAAAIPAVPSPPPSPERKYDSALAVHKEGRYAKAREMFTTFLRDNSRHPLAGNAQYWIAETYYSERDFDDAILAYEDLLQTYKGHSKVPAALLKQGYAFLELGDKNAARGILKELMHQYPESEQAGMAHEKLNTIKSGPGPIGPAAL